MDLQQLSAQESLGVEFWIRLLDLLCSFGSDPEKDWRHLQLFDLIPDLYYNHPNVF